MLLAAARAPPVEGMLNMHVRYVTVGLIGLMLASSACAADAQNAKLPLSAVPIDTRDAFPGETRPQPAAATSDSVPLTTSTIAAPAATATTTATTELDPVVLAVRGRLADKSLISKASPADDVAAIAAFYAARPDLLWTKSGAYTERAEAVIGELQKAGDWGLEPADFAIPELAPGAGSDVQAAAEVELGLACLRYARYARGGRLDPRALSNILDMVPPVLEPGAVLAELATTSTPDAYLRGLNPRHVGFERLRQALLALRGASPKDTPVDPALLVELPAGKLLKPGAKDDQIALLRKRLKVPAGKPEDERLFDEALVAVVRSFQTENGLKVTGTLNNRTRAALNAVGHPGEDRAKREVDRLLANMERWRWLPADLGQFYVMNNIPEFVSEIWKGSELKLKQRIIVGQPSWPTPVLAADMQFVIFHPSWGMPDGIKRKELLPRLKRASEGDNFFDQLFGGGSGVAQVVKSYKLQVTQNGRPVDPDTIDWSTADIRKFEFVQPPGADNPLGQVKFRFPNSHNVYMHDTPQRGLFGNANRALSHGCMRLSEPRKTAEVILSEDKGWSVAKVDELYKGGSSITLDKPVPVYLVYFTARVDDEGHLHTFGDIYGNDGRVMQALRGHAVRYVARQAVDPTEAAEQKTEAQRAKGKS